MPETEIQTLRDNQGRLYRVEIDRVDDFLRFDVFDRSAFVGRCMCTPAPSHLEICDLHVFDKVWRPEKSIVSFARSILRLSRPKFNYRGLGIGTSLLRLVVEFAGGTGCTKVSGQVVALDYDKNPKLLAWYRKQGFTVTKTGSKTGTVARISKNI